MRPPRQDAEASVVPPSLLVSMVVVRLLTFPALPGADIQDRRTEKSVDVIHPRCAGVDVST